MDIGGGSVEFIQFQDDQILFKGSYKIGVAELFRKFHHQDPASSEEIRVLEQYIDMQLSPMIEVIRQMGSYYLIGASGSFEVLNDVLPRISSSAHWSELEIHGLKSNLDDVIQKDLESRLKIPEIPPERADFIVVAYVLIRYLIQKHPPDKLYYCDYALKEGVLEEMIRLKNI
jgi:exopolyphosphatase/guanosine-5'-triphosphate,3'-diphosphate pyrophosphatase